MPNYFHEFYTIMKRQTTLAMFGILFAAAMALGAVTVSGFSQPLFVASTDTKAVSHMTMLGHVTLTATDQDGKITSYIQTDNIIVNRGENCIAESLFNVTTTGTFACDQSTGTHTGGNGVSDAGFTYIAIGTGGSSAAGSNNQTLSVETMRIKDNSTSISESDFNPTAMTGMDSAEITLSAIFTATGSTTINESGVFDSQGIDAGNMLARKTFTSPAISLNSGDKLTVEWEFKIGGTS
jgi:hypothetical protein